MPLAARWRHSAHTDVRRLHVCVARTQRRDRPPRVLLEMSRLQFLQVIARPTIKYWHLFP